MRIAEWEWEYWYKNEDTLLVMLKLCNSKIIGTIHVHV